ncbi:MAG: cell division protein FtsQ/DivIB [Cellulosilyticaceae bacterium]
MRREKESMKKRWLYGVIIIIFVGIVILLLPIWNVSLINVENNNYYTKEEILKASELKENMHILSMRKNQTISKIKQLPYIKNVEIAYHFPGKLTVSVEEIENIGYVPFFGTYLSIDASGQVVAQVNETKQDLPIIEGLIFKEFKIGEKLSITNEDNFLTAVEIIRSLRKYDFANSVKIIDLSDINEIHLYVEKLDVIIGNMRDFDKKLEWLIQAHRHYSMGILDLSYIEHGQAILKPLI